MAYKPEWLTAQAAEIYGTTVENIKRGDPEIEHNEQRINFVNSPRASVCVLEGIALVAAALRNSPVRNA